MDVATWLHGLGLEQYEQAFRENDIDAEVLTDLTAEDLIGLGVTSIGHRRKFLAAIAALRVDPSPQAGSPKGASGPPSGSALPPPMAERRQITVLFYDLVGSTALATRQDPEDVREALSAFHRRIGEGVVRFGGFVARTMGDGALAYFGYPQAHEDDAERAVRAGLAAIDAVAGLTLPDGRAAQVRIGIATGLAVVGEINGIGRTPEDDIAGETPNLAARLQTIAKPDEIVVAASTRRLVGDLFEFHDLGAVEVKGFAEPVRAWRVLGASMVASRFEALHGSYGFTPLIGRAEETELLLRRWTLAKSGEGRVVLLSGEPGIGKSRIAAAVEEAIRNEPHVRLHYYCSPHHTGSALYPIVSQLERAAGFGRDDTVDTKLTKLETLLAKSATSAEDMALLAELSSLPAEGRYPPLGLSPNQKRVRTLTALLRQLDSLSRRCPVLMLFEDAHWADPTSLEVLNLAVERAQQLPALILVTFRPEFRPPWIGQPHVTALTIARLQRSEGAALAELVAGKQLPADILDQIVTRTDGVPLFLEELTKAVLESGLLREQDGCHVLDRPPQGLVIPTSLQASLIARLDRLAPEKDVIQTGAAIGREFSYEVLAAVVALPEDHLRTALERLVSAELIFARGTPPDATYLFKHALVQDAAYATLLRSRRQQLHARIAAVLEEHFADVVEAQPEILAHHCAQARLSAKAIAYGQKAGDLAIRRSAMTEAIGHLTRALDLLETLPDDRQRDTFEFRLQLARAGALLQASGWASPQMGEAYSRARELSRKLDDIPELEVVLALFGQWTFHHNRAELDTAWEIAEELLHLKTMHAGALTPALAHRAIGSGLMFRGQFENARTELELALSYYEPSVHEAPTFFGSANTRVVALSFMAWIRLFHGDIAAAHTASREALERARDLTSPYSLAFTVHTKCLFNQVVGNPSGVQDYSAQLVALATEQGYRHLLATATFFQGWAAFVEGYIELGVANMQRGLAAKREGGAEIKVPYYLGLLAESYRQLGRAGDALLLLTDALDRVERTGERWFEAELHRLKAEVLMGHPACSGVEAEASLARALSTARAQAARLWELRASASLARLWRDQGRHADARELLAPVLGRFTKDVDQPDLRHAWELLDTVRQ